MTRDEDLPLSRQLPVPEDVEREVAHHLAERERELLAQGWSPDAAALEARRAFGNIAGVEAECRDIAGRTRRARHRTERWEALRQDVTLGCRLLRKSPAFTIAAVLTLALGVGANAAIFSAVNGILLRPLPYEHPEELMDLRETHQPGWGNVPWATMLDLQQQSHAFVAMASYGQWTRTALTNTGPISVRIAPVSKDFFTIFGVTAWRGRLPGPEDHRNDAIPVAVVSYQFWRDNLGSPQDLTDQQLRSNRDYQVIGVLPQGFSFPSDEQVWVPLELVENGTSRTAHNWSTIGRLRTGVTAHEADRELDTLMTRLGAIYRPDFDAVGAEVASLQDILTLSARRPLYLLFGASGLLLLAACINLASTMLARGMARRQEMAIRIALGAGRLRIVRQLVTESLLIALLGSAAGLIVAVGVLRLFVSLAPATLRLAEVHLDVWVFVFTGLVAIATAILIGLFPALRTSGATPGLALREGGRAGASRDERRIWQGLVVAEVMLALTLLSGSGLLIRSFAKVLQTDPGFRAERVLTVSLALPTVAYDEDRKLEQLWTRVLASLRTVPGVEAAGLTSALPLTGNNASGSFGVEGIPAGPAGYGPGNGGYRMISEDYFDAMGIPIVAGRDFDGRDVDGRETTVIINQALANAWFKDRSPIGQRIQLQSGMDAQGANWLTIVGVVGDVHHRSLTTDAAPETYVPMHQRPTRGYSVAIALRTTQDPATVQLAVERALKQIAPDVVPNFLTMSDRVLRSQTDRRFTTVILASFAVVALMLAGVGIYGVVSYTVAQRTREMGVRLALGASTVQVRRMVQFGAMGQVGLGIVLGMGAAVVLTRLMASLLYGIGRTDPYAFGLAAVLLVLVGWIASWLPARRLARLDPMRVIRTE